MSPTSLSGPGGRSGWIVVVELIVFLLCKEPLELWAEFVAARQIFVPRQQRPILLRIDEGIVLSRQRRHHLSDFSAGLDLLVDLDLDFFCRFGQRLQRQV